MPRKKIKREPEQFRIGDVVERVWPPNTPRGDFQYFVFPMGQHGRVYDLGTDCVYIEGCGDWPVHVKSITKVTDGVVSDEEK